MKDMAPVSGDVITFAAIAALVRSSISALETPASTHSVRLSEAGSTERTAAGLRHMGERIFGFQYSGSSKSWSQDLITRQTKPLLPLIAVSKPWAPRVMISALSDIE